MYYHGQEITRRFEPELIEGYEQLCIALGIAQPPKLVFDANSRLAHCILFDDKHIYVSEKFLGDSIGSQLEVLEHELYHIHEYVIGADRALDVNVGQSKPKREGQADSFAALTHGKKARTMDRVREEDANRKAELEKALRQSSKRLREEAKKTEAKYVREHGTADERVRRIEALDIEDIDWAQKVIERRNRILENRQARETGRD